MEKINFKLLKKISETNGVSGNEKQIRNFIIEQIKNKVDDYRIDNIGNLIALKKGEKNKKVVLAAHMDEIGFIVNGIDDDGFIKFSTLGGFDVCTISSHRVVVHGTKDIHGVIASKPVHLMTPEQRKEKPKIENLFIDTGIEAENLKKMVEQGNFITRHAELFKLGENICGKSLDNRISVYTLIEVINELENKTPDYDTYFVFTVQEELGLRGAQTVAPALKAEFSLAVDTTIANDVPGFSKQEQITALGKGAAIKIMDSSVLSDSRMVRFLKDIAKENKIEYQTELLPAGGTDAGKLQQAVENGSVTGAVSIPTRHIHQVIESVSPKDVVSAVNILTNSLMNFSKFSYEF